MAIEDKDLLSIQQARSLAARAKKAPPPATSRPLTPNKPRTGSVRPPPPPPRTSTREWGGGMPAPGGRAALPADALLCLTEVSLEGTQELMRARDTGVILATGGIGLV